MYVYMFIYIYICICIHVYTYTNKKGEINNNPVSTNHGPPLAYFFFAL